ncbi:2Fe-2S iron-sulfur cluster-binding protein [Penaeicola halotolerans]|uniref:2Fe-2S iron-sulfur cluster-binding protein n=1 Tax=Penaeicola halotolerans TaxID=2793196 RepID=UPI001CF80032|nr:2Fe-2S iron-sulfur cluster-binding protein [Penaeicola halotolerans]
MVNFEVEDYNGQRKTVEVPEDMGLSLMEVLKASDYEVLATCGGMALCATCHVEVLSGEENLGEPNDAELDMIDTLPNITPTSRLACQLKISEEMNGMVFRLKGDGV